MNQAGNFAPMAAFARNASSGKSFWMIDILWTVLVDGSENGGAFSVIEQQMREGSGPPVVHIHSIDEWFYVLAGEMTAEVGGETIVGRAGDSLWSPRGVAHRFKVTSPLCHALNGYAPAGFEQIIKGFAKPAERRELPPPMDPPDQATIDKIFNNYWTAEAKDPWSGSAMGIR